MLPQAILKVLVKAGKQLFPQCAKTVEYSLGAISTVVQSANEVDLLIENGGVDQIVTSMERFRECATVQVAGCRALRTLTGRSNS